MEGQAIFILIQFVNYPSFSFLNILRNLFNLNLEQQYRLNTRFKS